MRIFVFTFFLASVVVVNSVHTFVGTNVMRPLVYHHTAEYASKVFKKRVENLYFAMPALPSNAGRTIQGILAYDMKNTEATANITQGGIGHNFVNLRMKSERGRGIHYDIYIYT